MCGGAVTSTVTHLIKSGTQPHMDGNPFNEPDLLILQTTAVVFGGAVMVTCSLCFDLNGCRSLFPSH